MYSVFSITPFLPKLSHSGGPWPVGSEEPLGLAIEKYLADTATVGRGSGLGGGKVCQCANVRAADRRANTIRYIVCIWRRRAAIALLVNKNHEQHVWSRFSHGFLALLSWLEHNFGAGFVGFLRFKKIHNYGLRNVRELRSLRRSLGKKKPRDTFPAFTTIAAWHSPLIFESRRNSSSTGKSSAAEEEKWKSQKKLGKYKQTNKRSVRYPTEKRQNNKRVQTAVEKTQATLGFRYRYSQIQILSNTNTVAFVLAPAFEIQMRFRRFSWQSSVD